MDDISPLISNDIPPIVLCRFYWIYLEARNVSIENMETELMHALNMK